MPNNFSWCVRVYYEDTDAGGVVFYANYLKFFERARSEWLRTAGVEQQSLMHADGVMFVVTSTAVDYLASAQLDDELKLTVVVEKLGRASVQFVQQAWRGEQLMTTGRIKIACVDVKLRRPCPIPARVLLKITP
ncbi:MAG: tol-pal system-associated acyl-CoA thioesterase [Glaciimonas sp.]|nr:tol-pal system-associated acyl-CoA thioesterase [Glaciimonas sp.]